MADDWSRFYTSDEPWFERWGDEGFFQRPAFRSVHFTLATIAASVSLVAWGLTAAKLWGEASWWSVEGACIVLLWIPIPWCQALADHGALRRGLASRPTDGPIAQDLDKALRAAARSTLSSLPFLYLALAFGGFVALALAARVLRRG
jgi:hypothetical protein